MSTLVKTAQGIVEISRSGKGTPIIGIHGTPGGCDHGEFYFAQHLVDHGFDVIAVSRPGYMGTPVETGRTPYEQADAIAALLDSLEIDKCAVCAVSGGSPTALAFAIKHPSRISCLVLDGPLTKDFTFRGSSLMESIFKKFFFNNFSSFIMRMMTKLSMKFTIYQAIKNESSLPRKERKELLKKIMAMPDKIVYVRNSIMATIPFKPRREGLINDLHNFKGLKLPYENIKCPVLITHGTADSLVTIEHSEQLAKNIPHAVFTRVEKGFHLLALHEDCDRLWQNRIDFLKKHSGRS